MSFVVPGANTLAGIQTVTAGTNITLGGTSANPIINASGTLGIASLTAGSNITLNTTTPYNAANPQINASVGVTGINAGTAITVTGSSTAPTINNNGVTGLYAGSGLGVSGNTGNVTMSNTGVLSVQGNVGISAGTYNGAVTLNNTGCLSVVAGNNVTVTKDGNNNYTVNSFASVGPDNLQFDSTTLLLTDNNGDNLSLSPYNYTNSVSELASASYNSSTQIYTLTYSSFTLPSVVGGNYFFNTTINLPMVANSVRQFTLAGPLDPYCAVTMNNTNCVPVQTLINPAINPLQSYFSFNISGVIHNNTATLVNQLVLKFYNVDTVATPFAAYAAINYFYQRIS